MLLTTFFSFTTLVTLSLLFHFPHLSASSHRRLLHQPFFPLPPSPTQPPSLPPSSLPKHPFSTSSSSPSSTISDFSGNSNPNNYPFFPTYPSSPPPPSPPSSTALPTFPANISSLALPSTPSPHSHSPLSSKLVITLVLLSLLTLSLIITLSLLLHRRHRRNTTNLHYSPSQKPLSPPPPPPPPPPPSKPTTHHLSHTSTDLLYVTNSLTNSRDFQPTTSSTTTIEPSHSEFYLKLCGDESPELRPLPPLPRTATTTATSSQQHHVTFNDNVQIHFKDDEDYYSPTSLDNQNNSHFDHFGLNLSPTRSYSDFPESDSDVSVEIQTLAARTHQFPAGGRVCAPTNVPPPPPPPGMGPPPLVPPSGPVVFKSSGNLGEKRKSGERKEESIVTMKPKLKALHWDKVRASSDRVMVWDHLLPGSFQLNEEMIETLFKANGPTIAAKDGPRRSSIPLLDEDYRVLDPKKSQNIAILLKALNVTQQEVCEALLEGNADALGTELLESLLKMGPTIEEERKLREYHDESPLKLGPAEKFLKAVLDHVPFAFKRVDAMLYIATFDSDVEYLRKSFETLEAACAELRNSRMFLKLLEAVLKTGNRMNVGTNRGDAQAFKLDTLLKLIDVKGTDGKTTLLHFVVQEIIKSEGSRLNTSKNNPVTTNSQPALHNDIELRKRGLEVVSALGGELVNVKKAAAMDSNALTMEVAKLAQGIIRVNEVLQLNEQSGLVETNTRFSESMNGFLKKAEVEIARIQSQEKNTFLRVKELTEYFHGNLAEEKAHPLRIFTVVRDFLGVLDQVCKEVGKVNERTIIGCARPHPTSVNPSTPPPFPEFSRVQGYSSSDNESFSET